MPTYRSVFPLCSLLLCSSPLMADGNLVPTGQFDQPADVDGWTVTTVDAEGSITFTPSPDEGNCSASGSALLVTTAPGTLEVVYSACAGGITGGNDYSVGLELLFPDAESEGSMTWGVTWLDGLDCAGADVGTIWIGAEGYAFGWQALEFRNTAPLGAASVRVDLRVSSLAAPGPLQLNIDRLFVRPIAEVFDDGFEIGESCRWIEYAN